MLPLRGLYEIAIKVKDLPTAEAFYKSVLDLEEGIRDEQRKWLFLRTRGNTCMVVLQEEKGEWPKQHFAFAVEEADLERSASLLRERGVEVTEPVFHAWIPARSIYFADPDGNDLELCAEVKR